ncbi:MAG: hypothetical protein IJX51_00120 [Clostridia bacterium]|nr:hypothetical protein [Clostridia bacterium]
MKKVKFLRIASVMLMLCLITTCAISGTFAKYTTSDTATDIARVAKWGVYVTVEGQDAFATDYGSGNVTSNTELNTNLDNDDLTTLDNVLAPGTNGTLTTVKITGQPEVKTNVTVVVNLDLGDKWTLADNSTVYCPLVFTVKGTEYKIDSNSEDMNEVSELEAAVEEAIVKALVGDECTFTTDDDGTTTATEVYDANKDFGAANSENDLTVGWSWADHVDSETDAKDTELGNKITADGTNNPTVSFTISVTVDQVVQ